MSKLHGNMRMSNLRACCGLVWAAAVAMGLSSCSVVGGKSIPDEALKLTLTPSAPSVRPGEAVFVEAKLENTTNKQYTVRTLNGDSLSYWWWSDANATPTTRRSVTSGNEDRTLAINIPAHSSLTRKFVLTEISGEPGKYHLQGIYATPVGRKRTATTISLPALYEVAGERMFTRGEDGVIVREDALRVAKDYIGRPTSKEDASLVKNEAGFFDWWVTLTVAPSALAAGERAEKGFFVNAHTGAVRKEAKPQEKAVKEEQPIPAVSHHAPEATTPASSEPPAKK